MNSISMVEASLEGNPKHLSFYFKELLPILLTNLQSPLAAPHILKLYTNLRKAVFTQELETLSQLICNVTLRLCKPQCDLDAQWEEENLKVAVSRTIKLIHNRVFLKKDPEISVDIPQNHFTAPTFCYIFTLIKLCLTVSDAKKEETVLFDCIQIISDHSKLRGHKAENGVNLFNPKLLPLQQMFELLISLISKYIIFHI